MKIINQISKENKIPRKLRIKGKEVIYLADFEIDINFKKTKTIKGKKYTIEEIKGKIVFKDEIFSKNRSPLEQKYFEKDFERRYKLNNKGKPTISRIVLKKEIGFRNF